MFGLCRREAHYVLGHTLNLCSRRNASSRHLLGVSPCETRLDEFAGPHLVMSARKQPIMECGAACRSKPSIRAKQVVSGKSAHPTEDVLRLKSCCRPPRERGVDRR